MSFPVNSREGWLSGWNIVRHYVDGTWYADQVHITGYHNDIEFIDNQTGWTCGDRILHTGDGYNWTEQVTGDQLEGDLFSINFCNSDIGCAVGTVGQVFFTTNGGNNWNKLELGTSENLIDVWMTSPTCGYITGQGRQIFKYTQNSSVRETKASVKLKLHPNPTTCLVNIQMQTPVIGFDVQVFDVYGKLVLQLKKQNSNQLDLSALPPALYMVQVTDGGQVYLGKILKQ